MIFIKKKHIFATMEVEFFIAKRLFRSNSINHKNSNLILRIAQLAVSISVAVMIIAISVILGFKKEITEKAIGFASHIQITNFDSNTSFETLPISDKMIINTNIKSIEGVKNINKFIQKAGIVKTENELAGVIFKGVSSDYDWSFVEQYLVEGELFTVNDSISSNNIVISKDIADKLSLKLGDNFKSYYIQDPPRMRNYKISAIYNTRMSEFDKLFVFVDIKHLQKINNWNKNQITGYEVNLNDFSQLDKIQNIVQKRLSNTFDENSSLLRISNVKESYPAIFDWLELLDMNVWVILILMIIVSAINMISCILVVILERVNFIGIMKSFGTANASLRKIFLYFSSFIIVKGLFWGNLLGFAFCLLQKYFHIIKLDANSYYMNYVPISFDWEYFVAVNIFSAVAIILFTLLPIIIVSKIKPSETIKFD